MIGGSQAAVYYGEPRFTRDVDVVAGLGPAQIHALLARFPAPDFYVSGEAAREAVETRGQFNIIHPASGLKIDIFVNRDTPYDRLRLERRRRLPLVPGRDAWVRRAEDGVEGMITRRPLLSGLALAGGGGLLGLTSGPAAAEPPPETTRVRLVQIAGICVAPQYVAEELLRAEGFVDVQYVQFLTNPYKAFAAGDVDLSMAFVAPFILQVDRGNPIVLLGGVHVGCYELFGTDRVNKIG